MTTTDLVIAPQNVMQALIALEAGGAIDAVSLTLTDPDMEYDRWEAIGRLFGILDQSNKWWIADWLNFGDAVFGEMASQAVESTQAERYDILHRVTGHDPQVLANIASIGRRVARTRRRVELGFWPHGEVAKMEPQDQVEWLERAVTEGWRRSELRAAIKEHSKKPGDPAAPPAPRGEVVLTVSERIEAAARVVLHTWQSQPDGSFNVPPESAAQLRASLGEE